MEWIIALKCNIPPDNSREFFELNWYYDRYVSYQQEERDKGFKSGMEDFSQLMG